MEEVGHTTEYLSAGLSYQAGSLTVGTGVETEIRHGALTFSEAGLSRNGEEYETNYFAGVTYEVADGLTFGLGIANLDSDSWSNRSLSIAGFNTFTRGTSGRSLSFNATPEIQERRTWVAGASVRVDF